MARGPAARKTRRTKTARPGPAERARSALLAGFRTRFSAIAAEAGCEDFSVFLLAASPAKCRLQVLIDGDHPRTSRLSRRLAARPVEAGAARLASSSIPFWWRRGARNEQLPFSLAEFENVLGLDGAGIAFPLAAEGGRRGLALFTGLSGLPSDDAIVDIHRRAVALFCALVETAHAPAGDRPAMSNRELDCLRLTADGKTSEEIADLLGLSTHTATQYLTSAAQKLDAVSRTHAVAKALRLGLIT